jgi:hypothetical protein
VLPRGAVNGCKWKFGILIPPIFSCLKREGGVIVIERPPLLGEQRLAVKPRLTVATDSHSAGSTGRAGLV